MEILILPSPDVANRDSVKLRRLLFRKSTLESDKLEKPDREGKHEFYVLKMSFDQGLDAINEIREQVEADEFLEKVKIRELNPKSDARDFVRVYNRAFITAPDPYRSLSEDDVKHFNPKSTFVAVLYGQIIGFIFLTIEPLIKQGIEVGKQGVIAGIGVDPRYRRRKIAFLLACQAAKYFTEQDVDEIVCEVYHKNSVSYSFIRNFGMTRTGTVYL